MQRDFAAAARNRCWVEDFTHVATFTGVIYVAFVVDVYSWAIVGWSAATTKHTTLVLRALDMGLWRRDRDGRPRRGGPDPPLMPDRSTRRSGSPLTWSPPASMPRSALSAMPWTAH
ncbi:hypothetical protein U2F26_30195 [Micromonospora sp. 4G57]|uniref:Integrase catalytic domain-containing protein n=1 Tax=Micromonospora sicca TaxID=2202420 RepID=A0ABU5JMK1_9ACTN|nr:MULTISPECIES: DDE-type integrase/transposase/recombinase [unclassified Micromonospora]MDZ5446945.1 hypothetical protein [Micromonospora sp. 4G57]MDZ5493623.1 hypothetical protein [Micromonospora sp. 4G53]